MPNDDDKPKNELTRDPGQEAKSIAQATWELPTKYLADFIDTRIDEHLRTEKLSRVDPSLKQGLPHQEGLHNLHPFETDAQPSVPT